MIERPLRLIDLSMPFSEWSRDPARRHLIGFPSVTGVVVALMGRRPMVYQERVLSLRFYWEDNYFHFLNDILPRLRLATSQGISKDIPVVVGKKLASQKFFQTAFPEGTVDGRRVIVQRNAFVAAREVVFARPASNDKEDLAFVADLLGAPPCPQGDARIFVTRSRSRGRHIVNLDELLPVLERFGFEVVEADTLTMPEQVRLFSSAALIAGIHGAGLGNMIFRRNAACAILEIVPPGETSTWFRHMAGRLEFAYCAIPGYADGRTLNRYQPFKVRPQALEVALRGLAG
ncbi:MAG: glycosyltransferase family 61 protein [Chloroflexota bacterium]